jgi:hypothetical protein
LSLEKLGQTIFAVTMTKIPLLMGFLVYELNCLKNKISALITISDYQVAINDSSKFGRLASLMQLVVEASSLSTFFDSFFFFKLEED